MMYEPLDPAEFGFGDRAKPALDSDDLASLSEALHSARRSAFLFYAPARVDVAQPAPALPVTVLVAGEAPLALPFVRYGALIVTLIDSRTTFAARWSPWREAEANPSPPTPDDSGEVTLADGSVLSLAPEPAFESTHGTADLVERIEALPWRPGRWLVQLVVGPFASPKLTVELDAEAFRDDPAVEAFLASRATIPNDLPVQSDNVPTMWLDAQRVPPALAAITAPRVGVTAMLSEVAFAARDEVVALAFGFTLPLLTHELRQWPGQPQNPNLPVAVVPLTVVIVGEVLVDPICLRLDVPVFSRIEGEDGAAVGQAVYAVNLNALEHMPVAAGRYVLRVVAGAFQSEALSLTLVPENLRPVAPPSAG
ncbi:MAG: hypothetical protein JNK72_00615 [Myxococcales bacterium]|nr:hypothetical protein [Myxococcales bacterium]